MAKVDRREFIKLVGAGGVGTGAGFMLAEANKDPVEHLIPYMVPPEEFSPGVVTWYNSVCGMCSSGCGISVRTREGRPKKIEGNPLHPVNQGRLCALGQAGLQTLYNPDRLTGAMLLHGERGNGTFLQMTWDECLEVAAERIGTARDSGGNVYVLSEGVNGHLAELLALFTGGLGNGQLLYHDFDHPHSLYAANNRLFGEDRMPYYDIGNSDYLLSFGADFLNHWLSPVHHSLGFGRSRGRHGARGKFVQIEPKMSISGAAADEWVPATPGTEGFLALGIAHHLVAEGAYEGEDAEAWSVALADHTPANAAERTGVPEETIVQLADELSHANHGLVIGGGSAAAGSNGVDTLVAITALNHLVGNIGEAGGIIFNGNPVSGSSAIDNRASYQRMEGLVENARQGNIDVLIVNNTDPVFTMPQAAEFREAMASIPFIISLSTFMDDTTALADVILPSHTYLESWGDDMPEPGVGFSIGAVSQPVVSPLYDTRATGDIVIELGNRLGIGEAIPWSSMEDCIKEGWRRIYESVPTDEGEAADFDSFWNDVLVSGVWGENVRREDVVTINADTVSAIDVADPEYAGDIGEYPFILHPYVTTALYDGRGANLPWMQELPDPMTSIVYGSWVEINPVTAADMGISDGDILRVTSTQGTIEAPAVLFPAIMPEVVAMPIGQGHEEFGRYASKRGVNPIQILAPSVDADSGGLATGATRVSIEVTGRRAEPVKIGGEARQLGRGIVQTTGGGGDTGHSAKLNSIPIAVESA